MIDPKTLRSTRRRHEWVLVDGDVATVGISRFAVDQLTDLILIDLPKVGAKLTPGKSFGEVESVKAVSDLYAPVAGEVIEVNPAVAGRRPGASGPRTRTPRVGSSRSVSPTPRSDLSIAGLDHDAADYEEGRRLGPHLSRTA